MNVVKPPASALPSASPSISAQVDQSGILSPRLLLACILLLVLGVATNRYGIEIGGFNLRLELLIGSFLTVFILFVYGVSGTLRLVRSAGIVEYCLLAWLLVSYISTIFFSPIPAESLKLTVLVTGLLVLYWLGYALLRSARAVIWSALCWVALGALSAFVGIVSAVLYIFTPSILGITLEGNYQAGRFTATPKVHSTLWEPNLFGSFCLTVAVLAAMLSFAPEFGSSRWRIWLRVLSTIGFSGVMLSMTRTLWFVTPLVLIVLAGTFLWLKVGTIGSLLRGVLAPAVLGLALGLSLGFAMPSYNLPIDKPLSTAEKQAVLDGIVADRWSTADSTSGDTPKPGENTGSSGSSNSGPTDPGNQQGSEPAMVERITTLSNPDQITSFTGRLRLFDLAIRGWLERPILGWGTGSFQAFDPYDDNWIGNLELHILFDTGIVGLLLLLTAGAVPVWRGMRALRQPVRLWSTTHYLLIGLLVGGLALLLAYQTTEGLWLGFTWVFFAVLVAATRILAEVSATSALVEHAQETCTVPASNNGSSNSAHASKHSMHGMTSK